MTPNKTITFNTGRHYTPEGQEIEASEYGTPYDKIDPFEDYDDVVDQYVIFNDKSRMIKGKIKYCELSERAIMRRYDEGDYTDV